jgi:hypothetical protein
LESDEQKKKIFLQELTSILFRVHIPIQAGNNQFFEDLQEAAGISCKPQLFLSWGLLATASGSGLDICLPVRRASAAGSAEGRCGHSDWAAHSDLGKASGFFSLLFIVYSTYVGGSLHRLTLSEFEGKAEILSVAGRK